MNGGFYKSSYSSDGPNCVEIAHRTNAVLIRDSKYTGPAEAQPIVTIPAALWTEFLAVALGGESGRADDAVVVTVDHDGAALVAGPDATLAYTPGEWDAFLKGIADGQFDRSQ